jgi:outer membrane protein assembly factor BamA
MHLILPKLYLPQPLAIGVVFLLCCVSSFVPSSSLFCGYRDEAPALADTAAYHSLPPEETRLEERISFTWFPLLNFSPETQLLFAVIGGWNVYPAGRDTSDRPNQVLGGVYGTLRAQFGFQLFPDFYFNDERIRLYFQFDASRFPDSFFGIGNALPETNREPFTTLRFALIGTLLFNLEGKSIRTGWNIGPRFDFDYQRIIEYKENGLLATDAAVIGSAGGFLSGVGIALNYDSRDKAIAPAYGEFIEARVTPYTRLTGSDFTMTRFVLDARKFFPLPGEPGKHVLATHFYSDYSLGDVPFFRMGLLGTTVNGASILRGYFGGRYRDKLAAMVQAEYRFPIWWRFGGVLYGGVGDVASSLGSFKMDNLKASLGAGIRFALLPEERINLRFDVAYGFATGLPQFYISFAEAF